MVEIGHVHMKKITPKSFIWDMVENGHVYIKISKGMYGLPQAGRLTNDLLKKQLLPHGYYKCAYTPSLWRHINNLVCFTLWVNDFGVKYGEGKDVEHLMGVLKPHYAMTNDWEGKMYCELILKWNYHLGTCELSLPGYIGRMFLQFQYLHPTRPYGSPHPAATPQFGKAAQEMTPLDNSNLLDKEGQQRIQQDNGINKQMGRRSIRLCGNTSRCKNQISCK